MFIKWYDEDLRFQDEIPKAFERGYVFIEFAEKDFFNSSLVNLKEVAKNFELTYRQAETLFNSFLELTRSTVLYFEFEGSFLVMDVYLKDTKFNQMKLDLGQIDRSKPNLPVVEEMLQMFQDTKSDFSKMFARYCSILLECCLWYIATTTQPTKYYREGKTEPFYYEKKEIINPKRNKTITTPIYDMSKIRRVKTEGLIKRRKGWTYSHSFQVHGHYRHYQSGKVIFIEPFIKGKGKEEISQKIILNPKTI